MRAHSGKKASKSTPKKESKSAPPATLVTHKKSTQQVAFEQALSFFRQNPNHPLINPFLDRAVAGDSPVAAAEITYGLRLLDSRYGRDESKAQDLIKKAAVRGNLEAQFIMALTILGGSFAYAEVSKVCQSPEGKEMYDQIRKHFDVNQDFLNPTAPQNMESILWAFEILWSVSLLREVMEAFVKICIILKDKHPSAQVILGILKAHGKYLPPDHLDALKLIRTAALNGSSVAQYIYQCIAVLYEGTKHNPRSMGFPSSLLDRTYPEILKDRVAREEFEKLYAVDKEDPVFKLKEKPQLMIEIDVLLEESKREEAMDAETAFAKAQEIFNKVRNHKTISGEELLRAFELLRIATVAGLPAAHFITGHYLIDSSALELKPDPKKALGHFIAAADQQDPDGMTIMLMAFFRLRMPLFLKKLEEQKISPDKIKVANALVTYPESEKELNEFFKDKEESERYINSVILFGIAKGSILFQTIRDALDAYLIEKEKSLSVSSSSSTTSLSSNPSALLTHAPVKAVKKEPMKESFSRRVMPTRH